jgi:cytochrome c oxidase cbb3-type subunit 4
MDYAFYSSVMTVIMLVVFILIIGWAYSRKRLTRFEDAARVPFEEDVIPDERAHREQS